MPVTTFDPIWVGTLTSPQTFITISGIPTTYTDLLLTVSGFSNVTGDDLCLVFFNNDSGSNYQLTTWSVYGPTPTQENSRVNSTTAMYGGPLVLKTVGQIGNTWAYIPQYRATNKWKTMISRASSPRDNLSSGTWTGVWRNTSAITTINLRTVNGYQFAENTLVTLYGLKGA